MQVVKEILMFQLRACVRKRLIIVVIVEEEEVTYVC
jgi:hypothetical protein